MKGRRHTPKQIVQEAPRDRQAGGRRCRRGRDLSAPGDLGAHVSALASPVGAVTATSGSRVPGQLLPDLLRSEAVRRGLERKPSVPRRAPRLGASFGPPGQVLPQRYRPGASPPV
jgi:hypothetical protein